MARPLRLEFPSALYHHTILSNACSRSAAAGNIAGQLTGMATGIQDRFSWGSVATSAITAGLTQGLGLNGSLDGKGWGEIAWNAAQKNVINQGANLLFGQQQKFSWSALAASAITAPITQRIDERFGSTNSDLQYGFANPQIGAQPFTLDNFGGSLTGEFLKATTRQAANILVNREGKLDWKSIATDAFGNAVGNSIVGQMRYNARRHDSDPELEALRRSVQRGALESVKISV